MNENLFEQEQPEFYDIIPEFNSEGRLCNYHTGEDATVKVMADEWERFNQLAGRQHEIVDGVVIFNPNLEPCMPDNTNTQASISDIQYAVEILLGYKDDELHDIINNYE